MQAHSPFEEIFNLQKQSDQRENGFKIIKLVLHHPVITLYGVFNLLQ